MMNVYTKSILAMALFSGVVTSVAARQPQEVGYWMTESGNLEVNITPCGNALCGTVTRVLANRSMSRANTEMQAVDRRSPLGMQILTDFHRDGSKAWHGKIYNRENAKTYDCVIELIADNQLKVRPYKGISLFGKTQIWQRISGDKL